MDQGGQGLHVVGLEGGDVAGEQLAIGPRGLARGLGGAYVDRFERRPRPLERAVHGRHARVEQLSDLVRLPAKHLAEDQHGTLARREVLQRRDEREADRLVSDGDLRRIAGSRADERVGHGLDPRDLRQGVQVRLDRLLRRAEVHRPRTALPAAQHVEADVRGDAVEPRAKRGSTLEAVEAAPRPDERLLNGVLHLERRPEHAVGVRVQLGAVLLEPALELIACDRRGLHCRHRRCCRWVPVEVNAMTVGPRGGGKLIASSRCQPTLMIGQLSTTCASRSVRLPVFSIASTCVSLLITTGVAPAFHVRIVSDQSGE